MPESRKKYEIKLLIILGIIFCVLVAMYFIVNVEKETQAASLNDTSEFQLLGTASALEMMVDGDHFELEKADGVWKLKGDDSFKVNDTMCDGIMYQMKNLPINKVITDGMADAEKYGLVNSENWINIKTNAGDAKLIIGAYNSVTLEFYLAFEGGNNVFMADYNSIAYCLRPLSNFEAEEEDEAEGEN